MGKCSRGARSIARFRRLHPPKKCLYDHLRPTRHPTTPMSGILAVKGLRLVHHAD
ncbi:hypothetical protein SJ05684_c12720 [Sinorhizobium sojae CCBAU 05684]|uniref:Uncharacterized protein n=1 Tax=Sinorhizobium sojae CCBAU 05684 TaxID=716928 RepID=A0A249PAK2_9HYPH|nr:hypothetical protein SJ05684_c12720 [Sinorhizobium sojae CCBAU 05684]